MTARIVRVRALLRHTVPVATERDIAGDAGFGLRQLTDIALRAIAPGVNDPSSAVTCIGYLQDLLSSVAVAGLPANHTSAHGATRVLAPRQTFALYLSSLVEIGRYARDARIGTAVLDALLEIATAAAGSATGRRHLEVLGIAAAAVGAQAIDDARTAMDRDQLRVALARVELRTRGGGLGLAHPDRSAVLVRAAEAHEGRGAEELPVLRPVPISTSARDV